MKRRTVGISNAIWFMVLRLLLWQRGKRGLLGMAGMSGRRPPPLVHLCSLTLTEEYRGGLRVSLAMGQRWFATPLTCWRRGTVSSI